MRLAATACFALALVGAVFLPQEQHVHGQTPIGEPRFEKSTIEMGPGLGLITSITFGPDGRLYAAWALGHEGSGILALTLDDSGREVVAAEEIVTGLQYILGLAFDPTAPADGPVLYASRQELTDPYPYRGRISTFSGPNWERMDVITGLPHGSQHMTNGLAFDQRSQLLIAQGQEGATPLSGAILAADVHAPSFNGDVTYVPPGASQGNDVDQVSGDVHVFAPGLRNPYDLVVHTNGRIDATDNAGGGGSSCTEAPIGVDVRDELNLVEEGLYYGNPNSNRARFNPKECVYRGPKEPSEGRYRAPIAIMPPGSSCNGIAEYASDAFDGEMNGDLLCPALFAGELRRAVLSDDGCAVVAVEVIASELHSPLDVAVKADGTIYVGGSGIIHVLHPAYPSTAPTPVPMSSPAPCPSPSPSGDTNCDGDIDTIDVALILQFAAGLITALPCADAADVNSDGGVSSIDAALVLQFVAGLLDHLPP